MRVIPVADSVFTCPTAGQRPEAPIFADGRTGAVFGNHAEVVFGLRREFGEVHRGGGRARARSGIDPRQRRRRVAVALVGSPFEVVVGVFAVADEGAVELGGGASYAAGGFGLQSDHPVRRDGAVLARVGAVGVADDELVVVRGFGGQPAEIGMNVRCACDRRRGLAGNGAAAVGGVRPVVEVTGGDFAPAFRVDVPRQRCGCRARVGRRVGRHPWQIAPGS